MSPSPDLLDDEIRSALLRTPVHNTGHETVIASVEARARRRLLRRRGAVLAASVAAIGMGALTLVGDSPWNDPVVTDEGPTTTTTTLVEYGLAPLTPLVDAPLSMVPRTELAVLDEHVFTAEVSAKGLILTLTDPTGATGSHWADPQTMPAVTYSVQGPGSQGLAPSDFVTGATRPEVARIEVAADSDTFSVETFAHDAFPELRFFLIQAPPRTFVHDAPPVRFRVTAYAADGTVLTDSDRIHAESEAFVQEVDRRMGVEDKPAAIHGAVVQPDDQSIALDIAHCGAEARPHWTVDDSTVIISATVKRSYDEGPCVDGDTVEVHIGLEEPLDGRTLLDGRTGEPILTRSAPEG